jgi:acylglycerol lipase
VHHAASTLTTADGLTLATRSWMPHDRPKAAVLLVHGISEHSGRYAHVAARLLLHDYAVFAYDHRGHGRSEGTPRAYIDRFETLVEDLRRVVQWVEAEAPGLPLFLLGHSMGGAIVARYVAEFGSEGLAGVILSSPALRIPENYPLRRFAGIASRLLPRVAFPSPNRGWLSRDPAVARAWDDDPLTFKGGTRPRTGFLLLHACADLLDHAEAFNAPLLLFHGTADRITDPEGTRALYEAAPAEDKTLTLYEGGYHETMNDLEKERVLDDLTAWLDARAPARP